MSLGYPLAYPTDVGWLCPRGWRHGDTPRQRIEPTDPIMKPLKRGPPTSQQVSLSLCLLTGPLKRDLAAAVKFSLPPIHSFLRQFLKSLHTHKNPTMARGPGPAHRGRRGAARVSRLLSLLTWSHSAPPPIKSKRFVFNGLLR